MNGSTLATLVSRATSKLETSREELRELDAAIGDGDLGITVAEGCKAIRQGLESLSDKATPREVLQVSAREFAKANPSTLSALVAGGLLAASRAIGDTDDVDRSGVMSLLTAAYAAIERRGGAQLGDKTILDALAPSMEALERTEGGAITVLAAMAQAAEVGIRETATLKSQRGRAAWVGDRTIGHADGGATAYLRLLEALRDSWEDATPQSGD